MRNPFAAMALAAVAALQAFQQSRIAGFNAGEHTPGKHRYNKKTGMSVASARRAATKARNVARHKAACRG